MDIYEKILEEVSSGKIKLLYQINITDDNYSELIRYTRRKINTLTAQTSFSDDIFLSVALVQIAIRRYKERNYWDCFLDEIDSDISTIKRNYIGQIFAKTLKKYSLFELEHEKGHRYAYVENIKAHTFVPNSYLQGYFDFLFSFYDRNLFRQLTDTLKDDIEDLIDYMSESLQRNEENITCESDQKAVKSYRLLKATKYVISQCPSNTIFDVLEKHLKLIDDFYYDSKLPNDFDRFNMFFSQWVNEKENEINKKISRNTSGISRSIFYHKPYFEIDRNNDSAYLCIPEQKIRNTDFSSAVKASVISDNFNAENVLNTYKAYGVIITELEKVRVDNIFSNFLISISCNSNRTFDIAKNNYRIFDCNYAYTTKLKKGQNYILVEKDTHVTSDVDPIFVNKDYSNWDEYSYNISDNTVVYINNIPISIVGEFSEKPIFECVSKEYYLKKDNKPIQSAYRHPIVSFKIPRQALDGVFLWCNKQKFNINSGIASFIEFSNDEYNVGVTIPLYNILSNEEKLYRIYLDQPGKTPKLICEYVFINSLRCYPEKKRFVFCENATVTISGKYNIKPVNCEKIDDKYQLNLKDGAEIFKFELQMDDDIYSLYIPVQVFKYGFGKQWNCMKEDFVWCSELKNDLYLRIPGATKVIAYLGNDPEKHVDFSEVGLEEFRGDISPLVQSVTQNASNFSYLNINFYDNRWRHLPLYRIQKYTLIKKLNLTYDNGKVCVDTEFEGNERILLRLLDYVTGDIVVEQEIKNGHNVVEKASLDGLYTMSTLEIEYDDFGFSSSYTPIGNVYYKVGAIDYEDISNCKITINSIKVDNNKLSLEYMYRIFNLIKADKHTYYGTLVAMKKDLEGRNKQFTLSNHTKIGIMYLDNEFCITSLNICDEDDWGELYYDRKTHQLISWNDELKF